MTGPTRRRNPAPWLALVAGVLLGLPLYVALRSLPREPELPVLAQLPPFHLLDQGGRPFGSPDLRGSVWVVDFIFTRCPSACPRLTGELKRLQPVALAPIPEGALPIGLLSITVDPEHDTPQVLAEFARGAGADARVWRFLTGAAAAIEETVVGGFKQPMDRVDAGPTGGTFDIMHGTRFVLLDQHGRIRGYYDTGDAAQMATLREDLERLRRDPR